jgi:hypothetical protein
VFWVSIKLVRLIKICLKETYNKVHIVKPLSNNFPLQHVLKQGDALKLLFSNFALKCAIMNVQENQMELKLNWTHQLLVYADDVNLLGDNINTIRKTKKTNRR